MDAIKETFPDTKLFVKAIIETVFDAKAPQRIAFGELIALLLSNDLATPVDISKE